MDKFKLYFIPHAGSSAKGYLTLKRFIDTSFIECIPLELAGRGNRVNESCNSSIEEDAQDLYQKIKEEIKDTRYAIFGHSLGSLITYELVKIVEREKATLPQCIFLSGRCVFTTKRTPPKLGGLSEKEFAQYFHEHLGLPKEVVENEELIRLIVPVLRADIMKVEKYIFMLKEPLPTDLVVLYGTDDPLVEEEGMEAWRTATTGSFKRYSFEGDHFYFTAHRREVGKLLSDILSIYR